MAVEYADIGQNEQDLQAKIRTLLGAGTRYVWVVRLTGLRRVEVYEPHIPTTWRIPDNAWRPPGILDNPVPVEALYDPDAAHETALRNLLQRCGYPDLDAVREEGREEGRLAIVLHLLRRAIWPIPETDSRRIRRLDRDGLAALAEALLDFSVKNDLTAWLEHQV